MLVDVVERYLATRRALGFQLRVQGARLRKFAVFAHQRGDDHVRRQTVLDWAALAPTPLTRDEWLQDVVRFARYARAENRAHEVPPYRIFATMRRRRKPYIFTTEEIAALLEAARQLGPCDSLRPHTYYTLLGLLAATGLRISEALNLRFDDITDDGLLIRESKFHKSRLVPLHATTARALDRYLDRRQRVGGADPHIFISLAGGRASRAQVLRTFWDLLASIGLYPGRVARRPRLHDLRFTFAVRALEGSPEGRNQIGPHAVALATYMGHATVEFNYWYLEGTPRLMTAVADACEAYVEGRAR